MNSAESLDMLSPWLTYLYDNEGSDLLLMAESAPRVRIDGRLRPIPGEGNLSPEVLRECIEGLINDYLHFDFEMHRDVDFAVSWKEIARLRCSAFTQKGSLALSMRMIPFDIPEFDELGLPQSVRALADLRQGFVLFTGPTGSGKSTTLAALIDHINEAREANILTIEDPIEYIHSNKQSAVIQRELGTDCPTFARGLRSALRQDPDVLLVGEMRDAESMEIALTLAETGHLVFATLHTNDAPQAVDRIVNSFPEGKRDIVRMQLASSLAGVVSQRLVTKVHGGRVAAFEILTGTKSVRNLIREGRTHQIHNIMRTSSGEGMITLETSLAAMIHSGVITMESALEVSMHPDQLAIEMKRLPAKVEGESESPLQSKPRSAKRRKIESPAPPAVKVDEDDVVLVRS